MDRQGAIHNAATLTSMIENGHMVVRLTNDHLGAHVFVSDTVLLAPRGEMFGQPILVDPEVRRVLLDKDVAVEVDSAVRRVSGGRLALVEERR